MLRSFLLLSLAMTFHTVAFATDGDFTSLSCASADQKVKLVSRLNTSTSQIRFSIDRRNFQYNDGEAIKVLHFTNGETIVRDWNTGNAVLTFKEVPLTKSDRGSEKKIAISQSAQSGVKPIFLQCQIVVSKAANSRFFAQAD